MRMADEDTLYVNVRWRMSNDAANLFVQLSPAILTKLIATAAASHDVNDIVHNGRTEGCWRLTKDTSRSFLPLELCLPGGTVYASFNGGLLLPGNHDEGSVQVPDGLLLNSDIVPPCNGTQDARVRALSSIDYATRVQVDPLSMEDWDLFQVHADLLEGGGLLKSVSVVYRHQRLKLRIPVHRNNRLMHDIISLVVKDISTSVDYESSPWPTLGDASDNARDASDPTTYGLLRSDTEVIITPIVRTNEEIVDPYQWSKRLQLIPALQDVGQEVLEALERVIPLLQVMQNVHVGCIVVHPHSCQWSAALNRPEWVEVRLEGTTNNVQKNGTVARVVFSDEVPESCADSHHITTTLCFHVQHHIQHTIDSEKTANGVLCAMMFGDRDSEDAFLTNLVVLFIVLHPWLRWTLGAALLWDHVVVRPCAPPISISLDQVAFRPVRFEQSTKTDRTWLETNLRRNHSWLAFAEWGNLGSNGVIALGSLIVLPSSIGLGDSVEVFRLAMKNAVEKSGNPHLIIAAGEWGDPSHLASEMKFGLSLEEETIDPPLTDRLLTRVRLPALTTTLDATASLLKTLRQEDDFICILHGASGTGKTEVVSWIGAAAAADHGRAMLYLDCMQLLQLTKTLTDILSELDDIFRLAAITKSCLIVLDDLDRIAPNLVSGNEGDPSSRAQGANSTAVDQSKVVADRILQLHEAATMTNRSISILATCASDTSLNVSLCSEHVAVGMGMPDFNDRLTLFSHFLQGDRLSTMQVADLSATNFGQPTEGFRPRDLERLAARTKRSMTLSATGQTQQTVSDAVIDALQVYTPLSHIGLERPDSSVGLSWGEIGGLFTVKKKLESILLDPVKYRAIYRHAKIRLPRGILLLGPTGCGKSCMVPALAKACQFPLISCKGPEVLDKYIGASEAKIRELFHRAAAVAPSILFLDEMDALAPRRGSDHTGVTDRVVNQLLTFLDGVEDTSAAPVYVIAASSRPDKIDPALLRPGRLEQHLYIGRPETNQEWLDLFRKIGLGWRLSVLCREFISSDAGAREFLTVVKKQPLLCPADLKATMDTAQLNAVHRTLRDHKPEDVDHVDIEVEDLRHAFMSLRPCISPSDASMLADVYDRYRSDREKSKRSSMVSLEPLKTTLR